MTPTEGTTMAMKRHNILMPDDLWGEIERATANAGAKRGKKLSVSEWLRAVVTAKLRGLK